MIKSLGILCKIVESVAKIGLRSSTAALSSAEIVSADLTATYNEVKRAKDMEIQDLYASGRGGGGLCTGG